MLSRGHSPDRWLESAEKRISCEQQAKKTNQQRTSNSTLNSYLSRLWIYQHFPNHLEGWGREQRDRYMIYCTVNNIIMEPNGRRRVRFFFQLDRCSTYFVPSLFDCSLNQSLSAALLFSTYCTCTKPAIDFMVILCALCSFFCANLNQCRVLLLQPTDPVIRISGTWSSPQKRYCCEGLLCHFVDHAHK